MEHGTSERVEDQPHAAVTIKTEIEETRQPAEYVDIEVNFNCYKQELELGHSAIPEMSMSVKDEVLDYSLKGSISDMDNQRSSVPIVTEGLNAAPCIADGCEVLNIKQELADAELDFKPALHEYADIDYTSDQLGCTRDDAANDRTLGDKQTLAGRKSESEMSVKERVGKRGQRGLYSAPLLCVKCKKIFKNKKTLTKHVKVVHSKALHTCVRCFKTFKREMALAAHMRKAHRQFKCEFCKEVYKRKSLLNIHMRTDHESQCQYTCDYCEETLKMKKSLRNHILNVHGSGYYLCTLCNKNFKCEQYLSRHIATVHTALEHPCDVCGKVLRPKNLQLHMVNVHSEVRFKCELCGKMLKNKQYLRRHVIDLHGEQCPNSRPQLHQCDLCEKIFKNKVSLKRHTLCVHTTGSYACEVCNKNFRSEIYLSKHKTTVHVTEEHRCEFCEKIFKARHLLLKHARRVHKAVITEYDGQPK